jgi:hypothetical protein
MVDCVGNQVSVMNTAPSVSQRRTGSVSDHSVFLCATFVVVALVVVGFGPTYFYRPFLPRQDSLTVLVHVHGALMTAWLALFVVQVGLGASGRVAVHRRLGQVGFILLALIVATALPMMIVAAHLGGNHMPGPALPGLALVIAFLLEFTTLAAIGLRLRRQPAVHKRLMLLAAVAAMEAGVSRLPIHFGSLVAVHLANDAVLVPIIAVDTYRQRRLHPAFLWGALFILTAQFSAIWVSGTAMWQALAQRILNVFYG